jgi:hypothetical protein
LNTFSIDWVPPKIKAVWGENFGLLGDPKIPGYYAAYGSVSFAIAGQSDADQ